MPPHCEFAWRPPTFRVCSAVPPPPRDFVGSLLHCEPKIDAQLTLLAMQCLFWMIVIPVVGGSVIKPWLSRKAWRENFITRSQASLSKGFFIDLDRAATLEFMCGLLVILAQHGVGAALCVPAVLLGCDPTWSHPLACHGALCEAGYELSDVLTRAYQLAALPEKRSLSPPPLLVLLGVHHAMGLSMVVPMNLHYPGATWYHEGAMLLQGAAAVALLLQCYGFTLDITRPSHLRQMQLSLAVGWVALFYSRGLRYAQVALEAVFFFEREGAAGMRRGALVASALMGAMNVLVLLDITGKTLKFLRLSTKTPAPEDAPAHFEELQDLAEDSLSAPAGPALAPIRPLAALSARQRGFAKWRGAGVMVQHQLSVRRAKQA